MRTVNISEEVSAMLPDSFREQFVRTAAVSEITCAKCLELLEAEDETPVSVIVCVDEDPAYRNQLTQALLAHATCMDSNIWEIEGLFQEYGKDKKIIFRIAISEVNEFPLALFEPADLAMTVSDSSGDLSDSWVTQMLGSGMAMLLAFPKPDDFIPVADEWSVRNGEEGIFIEYKYEGDEGFISVVICDAGPAAEELWAKVEASKGILLMTGTSLGITEDDVNNGLQEAIQYGRAAWGFAGIGV